MGSAVSALSGANTQVSAEPSVNTHMEESFGTIVSDDVYRRNRGGPVHTTATTTTHDELVPFVNEVRSSSFDLHGGRTGLQERVEPLGILTSTGTGNNSAAATPVGTIPLYPECVPYTPEGEEASVFKYYCPLCMQYFKEIMKSGCCGNYICVQCCREYLDTKNIHFGKRECHCIVQLEDKLRNMEAAKHTPCPHCQVIDFRPSGVSIEEKVRDYFYTSNAYFVQQKQQQQHHSGTTGTSRNVTSPLRVGESFEDLKRKMVPYKSVHNYSGCGDYDEEDCLGSSPSVANTTSAAARLSAAEASTSRSASGIGSGASTPRCGGSLEDLHATSSTSRTGAAITGTAIHNTGDDDQLQPRQRAVESTVGGIAIAAITTGSAGAGADAHDQYQYHNLHSSDTYTPLVSARGENNVDDDDDTAIGMPMGLRVRQHAAAGGGDGDGDGDGDDTISHSSAETAHVHAHNHRISISLCPVDSTSSSSTSTSSSSGQQVSPDVHDIRPCSPSPRVMNTRTTGVTTGAGATGTTNSSGADAKDAWSMNVYADAKRNDDSIITAGINRQACTPRMAEEKGLPAAGTTNTNSNSNSNIEVATNLVHQLLHSVLAAATGAGAAAGTQSVLTTGSEDVARASAAADSFLNSSSRPITPYDGNGNGSGSLTAGSNNSPISVAEFMDDMDGNPPGSNRYSDQCKGTCSSSGGTGGLDTSDSSGLAVSLMKEIMIAATQTLIGAHSSSSSSSSSSIDREAKNFPMNAATNLNINGDTAVDYVGNTSSGTVSSAHHLPLAVELVQNILHTTIAQSAAAIGTSTSTGTSDSSAVSSIADAKPNGGGTGIYNHCQQGGRDVTSSNSSSTRSSVYNDSNTHQVDSSTHYMYALNMIDQLIQTSIQQHLHS
eukprot:CAMPEP_0174981632 /NCGR_PEP_ID=MMETSP0004_2-20121128/16007_1 /TAXON_ID=420556 /ORGANISM="Ochromonas sp., Strain CCMP1393" /LENGTH=888 /DNA_ID=CAMNT_0016233417 /DNA_START=120 /DNA_END=2786 /DNA_ORIENTATION=-